MILSLAEQKKLTIHPLADIVPVMADDEYEAFLADIRQQGMVNMPICITKRDGKWAIVDGRHRWRAVCDLRDQGVNVEFTFAAMPEGIDLAAYVISTNLHRRQLTVSQRAAFVLPFEEWLKEKYAHGTHVDTRPDDCTNIGTLSTDLPDRGRNDDRLAKLAGVSRRAVQAAKDVRDASPETFAKVQAGEISAFTAQRAVQQAKDEADYKAGNIPEPEEPLVEWEHLIFAIFRQGQPDEIKFRIHVYEEPGRPMRTELWRKAPNSTQAEFMENAASVEPLKRRVNRYIQSILDREAEMVEKAA